MFALVVLIIFLLVAGPVILSIIGFLLSPAVIITVGLVLFGAWAFDRIMWR